MSALPIGRESGGTPRRGVGREKEAGQGGGASLDKRACVDAELRVERSELRVERDGTNRSCWSWTGVVKSLCEERRRVRGVNCEREGFVRRVPLTGAKSEAFCFVLGGAVSLAS